IVDPAGMLERSNFKTMALALLPSGQVYRLSDTPAALFVALMFRYVSPAGPMTAVVGAAVVAARGRGVSVTDRWSWHDTTSNPVASPRERSVRAVKCLRDACDALRLRMTSS